MMLVAPNGAKVRCKAHKRYALAVVNVTDPGTMTVLFRTNDPIGVVKRGKSEAKRLGRPVLVFSLVTGTLHGYCHPESYVRSGAS